MSNYERVKAIIQSGCMAEVKILGRYKIFSSMMSSWNIRGSEWHSSIQECMDVLWYSFDSKETIDWYDFEYIRPIWIKPPVLKVGDMVEILEVANENTEYQYWCGDKKEMAWKWPFEIKNVYNNDAWVYYSFYKSDKSNNYAFPHYAVCLWTWGETIEIEWKKYLRSDIEKLNSL